MADTTKKAAGAWTESEKVGLLFQIIALGGPIPWNQVDLPEGRTLKAVQVMIDKEKAKIRKAKEAAGGEGSTKASKKRGSSAVEEDDEGAGASSKKKAKTPRKKKAQAKTTNPEQDDLPEVTADESI
ncbi:hypothetical protein MBLNU230_g0967t1 [Neophaeotheca triangularis]